MARKKAEQEDIAPKAQGEKRKTRKKQITENVSFKDAFSSLLSLKVPKGSLGSAIKESPLGESINYREAILLAQIIKATNGDTQAATFVRDTSGNKLKDGDMQASKRKKFEDF